MRRSSIISILVTMACGLVAGTGNAGASQQRRPDSTCSKQYTIDRYNLGQATAGLPVPREIFTAITACSVAGQFPHEPWTCSVGTLKPDAMRRHASRKIVEALFYSGDIETFLHLHARFCLTRESESPTQYTASYRGSHEYCTNACEEGRLEFTVKIEKTTGAVTVQYR